MKKALKLFIGLCLAISSQAQEATTFDHKKSLQFGLSSANLLAPQNLGGSQMKPVSYIDKGFTVAYHVEIEGNQFFRAKLSLHVLSNSSFYTGYEIKNKSRTRRDEFGINESLPITTQVACSSLGLSYGRYIGPQMGNWRFWLASEALIQDLANMNEGEGNRYIYRDRNSTPETIINYREYPAETTMGSRVILPALGLQAGVSSHGEKFVNHYFGLYFNYGFQPFHTIDYVVDRKNENGQFELVDEGTLVYKPIFFGFEYRVNLSYVY